MPIQGLPGYGELRPLMRLVGGRTELQWRTWILQSELVSGAGNFSTLVTSKYVINYP